MKFEVTFDIRMFLVGIQYDKHYESFSICLGPLALTLHMR